MQKIIEQRKLESSTDSEESEEDLDDDYDIGIDDIELVTEGIDDEPEVGFEILNINFCNRKLSLKMKTSTF